MDLLLFAVFFVVALAFFSLGKIYRAFFFVAGAGILLLILGVVSMSDGLYYQEVNQTNTSYSFSSDYFEFANDTVTCANCSSVVYNESSNTTPPTCCEHDVNTTISGSISESRNLYFEKREIEQDQSFVISLSFCLFGLGAFLDVGLQMLQQRKDRNREDDE